MSGADLYILLCADGSYYVGTTRGGLEKRGAEHSSGRLGGYTAKRRPVSLVFAQHFELITDAIAAERQIKGWSRAKKEALIAGQWNSLPSLARRRAAYPSRRLRRAPQDEGGKVDSPIFPPHPEGHRDSDASRRMRT